MGRTWVTCMRYSFGKMGSNWLVITRIISKQLSESDVIPENIDAIRALMGTESDWRASVQKTDAAIASMFE